MTDTMAEMRPELTALAAKCIRAFIECDDRIRSIIREAVTIITDPRTDPDDRTAAIDTLAEALFPQGASRCCQRTS